jgi:hypothetical protein
MFSLIQGSGACGRAQLPPVSFGILLLKILDLKTEKLYIVPCELSSL